MIEETKEEIKIEKPKTWEQVLQEEIQAKGIGETLRNRDWRIDNLYKIVNKDGKIITFKRNRVQRHYDENRANRNITGKSRQHGFSTYKVIDALDKTLFIPNSSNIIIAHTVPDAQKLFGKAELAWSNLPSFIKDMVYLRTETASGYEIGFDKIQGAAIKDQPGKVVSSLKIDTSGRSGTYTSAHITELSYLDATDPKKAQEVMSGTVPAVPSDGQLDIESTARGNFGEFYNLFTKSWGKEIISPKDFKAHFYNWQWDDYELSKITQAQIDFVLGEESEEHTKFMDYKETHKLTDKEIACYYYFWVSCSRDWDRVKQEYPTTIEEMFNSGEDRIFSGEKLNQYQIQSAIQVGKWKYYEHPFQTGKYVVGADPSEGVGKDNHAICVMKINGEKPTVVATFLNDSITPTELAYELAQVGRYYNSAMISVERNNSGHAVLAQLVQIYDIYRIYHEIKKDKDRPQKTGRMGWNTNAQTKYKMVYDFKEAVENFRVELNSPDLIEELRFYSKLIVSTEMGRTELRLGVGKHGGKHYDLAIAAFICLQTMGDAMALLGFIGKANPRAEELKLRQSFK